MAVGVLLETGAEVPALTWRAAERRGLRKGCYRSRLAETCIVAEGYT